MVRLPVETALVAGFGAVRGTVAAVGCVAGAARVAVPRKSPVVAVSAAIVALFGQLDTAVAANDARSAALAVAADDP